jgi:ABC-type glycerol-3-phosphate transport system permease component
MITSVEEQSRMPKAILIATVVGLGAVSTISALAGYAIAPGSVKWEMVVVSLVVMILVVLPYFLLRETALESTKARVGCELANPNILAC